MKALRGWIPTGILAATLLLGSMTANAGIITAGFASTGDTPPNGDPCTVDATDGSGVTSADLKGIITAGFTGIITAGYASTGIIVTDLSSKQSDLCGIIVTD